MKFIDLHTDLVNYFLPKERRFLGMKNVDFRKKSLLRHADIPGYKAMGTKVLVVTLFPLSITKKGVEKINPKKEIARQFKALKTITKLYPIFRIISSKKELRKIMRSKNKIGILINMEGGEAIESVNDLDTYYSLGLRSLSLTWMLDNQLGGGDKGKRGLTRLGKEIVKRASKLGIVLDLVHSSRKTFQDAMRLKPNPVVVSHCALGPLVTHKQNPTNAQIQALIKQNGLIGLSLLSSFYGKSPASLEDVIEHMEFFKKHYSLNNLAIGTDYFGFGLTGGVTGLSHVSSLKNLSQQLKRSGWTKGEVENVFWRNAYRLLINNLPN